MKKVTIKLLTLMLALMMVFGATGVPTNAAGKDAKAKSFCKTLNKGNKFCKAIGNYKVKCKKKGGKYVYDITVNTKVSAGMYKMTKAMVPDKYYETRDSFVKASKKLKKKAKKAGIKNAVIHYVIKADGEKLWEFYDGLLIYDKFDPVTK